VQLAEQFQGHRIVLLQAGGKLVDQPGLALDQGFQVSAEGFEFLDQGTIGLEGTQVCQIAATSPGQQVSINGIGLGPRRFPAAVHCLGVQGIDWKTSLQERRDEQAVVGLHKAGDLLGITSNAQEESLELGQAGWRMGHPGGIDQMALLVQHRHVMVVLRPVDASKEHDYLPQDGGSPRSWWPHTLVLEARPSINLGPRRVCRGSAVFR
jgi:hypothetical protein